MLKIWLWVGGMLLVTTPAYPWGYRGHEVIAEVAARCVHTLARKSDIKRGVSQFYSQNEQALGYLSNVPDTSWRRSERTRVAFLNSPHHYFGTERLLGPLPSEPKELNFYLKKVRALPTHYDAMKRRYEGKDAALEGIPQKYKKIRFYRFVGVAPFRAQELFDLLVSSFRCASQKKVKEPRPAPWSDPGNPFRFPKDELGHQSEKLPLPTYVCDSKRSRRADLYASTVLAGILAHFIGDHAQPYHPTADDDGWATGNGGIHLYYEDAIVGELAATLHSDVYSKCANPEFQKKLWKELKAPVQKRNGVVRLMHHLAANSLSYKAELKQLDDQHAVLKKGDSFQYGGHPRYFRGKTFQPAKRKSHREAGVAEAFYDFTVNRLAVGAFLLAKTYLAAWERGGRPKLQNEPPFSFPHDSPFIWPSFDQEILGESWERLKKRAK